MPNFNCVVVLGARFQFRVLIAQLLSIAEPIVEQKQIAGQTIVSVQTVACHWCFEAGRFAPKDQMCESV